MSEVTAGEVTRYWVQDVGETGWYKQDDAVDAEIRARFLPSWEAARAGGLQAWCEDGPGVLGYLILTDQFSRNMFRGDERAFATDLLARAAAYKAIERRWDLSVPRPERQFFYLPLMHSENLGDQDICIRLMTERLEADGSNLLHARVHREIVRRFGRFPYRNEALRRMTLASEQAFLDGAGYAGILKALQAEAA